MDNHNYELRTSKTKCLMHKYKYSMKMLDIFQKNMLVQHKISNS